MLADAARVKSKGDDENDNEDAPPPVQLNSKDEIKNYLKGMI